MSNRENIAHIDTEKCRATRSAVRDVHALQKPGRMAARSITRRSETVDHPNDVQEVK